MAPWARESENASEVAAPAKPKILADGKKENSEAKLMQPAADDANERN